MHQHFKEVSSYHTLLIYSNNTQLTQGILDHYIHYHCSHCLPLSSSSFYAYAFCAVLVYESYVIDGAVCLSPLVAVGVQWSTLVLSEEFPVPKREHEFLAYMYRKQN